MTHDVPPVDGRLKAAAAAESLRELLAANAAQSERERRVAPASIAAMREAGLFRLLTPSSLGGDEAGLGAQVDSLLAVAAADPSAGWVQMVSNAHSWLIGSFPERCQREVFADGPDAVVPGTLAAQGRARRVEEGWLLDGRWQFASGVDHGDWLMIGSAAEELPESSDRALHVVVPKADITVEDTWYTLGLRGTGSKDLVARDVFVPAHRAMPTRALFDGASPHGEGNRTHLNRVPALVSLSVQLAGAVVGIADGAVALHIARTANRREVYTGAKKAASTGMQARIAESAIEITTARLLVRSAADRCDEVARTGTRLDLPTRAELKWQATYTVELCRRAVERVFAAAGAHGIYDDSDLQTRFRDVNTACHHAIIDFDSTAQMRGRLHLGLEADTPLV